MCVILIYIWKKKGFHKVFHKGISITVRSDSNSSGICCDSLVLFSPRPSQPQEPGEVITGSASYLNHHPGVMDNDEVQLSKQLLFVVTNKTHMLQSMKSNKVSLTSVFIKTNKRQNPSRMQKLDWGLLLSCFGENINTWLNNSSMEAGC